MSLPLFDRLSPAYQKPYNDFFELTSPAKIQSQMRKLTTIVDLAEKVEYVLNNANPIWDTNDSQWGDSNRAREAYHWHLEHLSHVKRRLAQAIDHKRDHYKNTWMGKITQFILKLFCLWNHGNTAAIRKAEDFLLRYDSRYPLRRLGDRYDLEDTFWPGTSHTALRAYDLSTFYNYEPRRAIEVVRGNTAEMPRFMVYVR